ncbi:hypothetical protein DFJ73DRAFT_808014 [Zopfochytrium polystomum]|nr:hypothetical protein DFJ73DRAFT_808014 [Zopfochytrium polystomum]
MSSWGVPPHESAPLSEGLPFVLSEDSLPPLQQLGPDGPEEDYIEFQTQENIDINDEDEPWSGDDERQDRHTQHISAPSGELDNQSCALAIARTEDRDDAVSNFSEVSEFSGDEVQDPDKGSTFACDNPPGSLSMDSSEKPPIWGSEEFAPVEQRRTPSGPPAQFLSTPSNGSLSPSQQIPTQAQSPPLANQQPTEPSPQLVRTQRTEPSAATNAQPPSRPVNIPNFSSQDERDRIWRNPSTQSFHRRIVVTGPTPYTPHYLRRHCVWSRTSVVSLYGLCFVCLEPEHASPQQCLAMMTVPQLEEARTSLLMALAGRGAAALGAADEEAGLKRVLTDRERAILRGRIRCVESALWRRAQSNRK